MSIYICSRDTKPCIICFFLQLLFSWHALFHLLAWFFGPWHSTEGAAFQLCHFMAANRKYHASFRCTNWPGDARCTAAFPMADNELLRKDFSHQVGTSLLWGCVTWCRMSYQSVLSLSQSFELFPYVSLQAFLWWEILFGFRNRRFKFIPKGIRGNLTWCIVHTHTHWHTHTNIYLYMSKLWKLFLSFQRV